MKLTTLEMIQEGLKNQDNIYETICWNGNKAKVQAKPYKGTITVLCIDGDCKDEPLNINHTTIDYKWTRIQKPVDFITAVNSGKRIKHEKWSDYHDLDYVFDLLGEIDSDIAKERVVSSNWYVEED